MTVSMRVVVLIIQSLVVFAEGVVLGPSCKIKFSCQNPGNLKNKENSFTLIRFGCTGSSSSSRGR